MAIRTLLVYRSEKVRKDRLKENYHYSVLFTDFKITYRLDESCWDKFSLSVLSVPPVEIYSCFVLL